MKLTKKELLGLDHTKHHHESGDCDPGFTLLETCIALVIMMVVGLGAASLFFYSVTNNASARDRQLSMAVAQQQMERLRNTSFASLSATVTSTGGADKTVTSAGRQYRGRQLLGQRPRADARAFALFARAVSPPAR